ncbi:helix-turn-helix domain-containing protein [Sphingomonas sp. MMS24-J13]|uniref:helix-turn-helix domain-containing protein n=1 Tax=Sphingomonas sp. MMS24-J13 TaxID=3238686 RepID=UPI00384B94AD
MITSQQLRAARALLGLDQRQLAELAGVSLPTIQRMEASGGQVRGVVDTLVKVVSALEAAGIELLGENAASSGLGRGVRLRETAAGRGRGPRTNVTVLFDRKPDASDDDNAA